MSAPRLHIVHTESSCGWGGQEIRILSEARGMIERGHRVALLCPSESNIYRHASDYGVPATPLPIAHKRLRALLALRAWLKQHPAIDIINTHSSTDAWLTALACATLDNAPPVVRTRHVSTPVRNGLATRWLYQRSTRAVVTTGEALRERLIEENSFDPNRVTSIPTGIDLTRFVPGDRARARRELGLDLDAFLIGSMATLRIWKGHRYVIEALTRLPTQVQLLIVGDGPQRPNLERQVAQLELAGRVRFAGQQHDVVPWLQALDVFVLASYKNEGVPQAIMQAMAAGLPVVACPVGSIGEILDNGRTGRLIPPEDVDALAATFERLLANPLERERLGKAARETALSRFAMATMLEGMESVFVRAMQNDKSKILHDRA
jgi:glycosyltransferase involved in cell wall biosynthesis